MSHAARSAGAACGVSTSQPHGRRAPETLSLILIYVRRFLQGSFSYRGLHKWRRVERIKTRGLNFRFLLGGRLVQRFICGRKSSARSDYRKLPGLIIPGTSPVRNGTRSDHFAHTLRRQGFSNRIRFHRPSASHRIQRRCAAATTTLRPIRRRVFCQDCNGRSTIWG